MLNTVYRLVAPHRFEVEFSDIELSKDITIVRPTHLSICHADQRYYQGVRADEVLKKKLPMALIHEGIGDVIWDGSKRFAPGTKVVMVPNIPYDDDDVIAENYRISSAFRSSGYDGYMQDMVDMRSDRVVPLPDGLDLKVAAFTELVSVSMHAIKRFDHIAHERRGRIGIWGDGNLGYITASLLKCRFPDTKLTIFGVDRMKLMDFTFADETFVVSEIPKGYTIDHAFECVGGEAAMRAIAQIIDHIEPEGCVSLLGVSESPVPIETRMVLEKGLRLFGSSRSGRDDFEDTLALYEKHPEICEYLRHIVGAVVEIHSIDDMIQAFETDKKNSSGKTVMIWRK